MVDLPTTAVGSAASATSSSSGGQGGGASFQTTPTTIVNLPQSLQGISQNVTLGARLVGANSDGSVVLRTVQGDVTLQLPVSLQPGSQLQLQVVPGNPPTATLMFTAGDLFQASANNATQQAATNYVNNVMNSLQFPDVFGADTTNAQGNTTLVNLQTGTVMNAVLLDNQVIATIPTVPGNSPLGTLLSTPGALTDMLEKIAASGGEADSAQAQILSQFGGPGRIPDQIAQLSLSGKLLETVQQTVQMLQSQPGGAQGLSNSPASLQLLQLAAQNLAGGGAPGGLAQAGQSLALASQLGAGNPVGGAPQIAINTELNLKLAQIILPDQAGESAAMVGAQSAGQNTPTITGQLTSQTINGQPVVQTPQGVLLLQANSKLPPGTTLVFQIIPDNAASAGAAASQSDAIKTISAMPRLEAALLTMMGTDSDVMRAVLASMPKLNGMLPASALFYLQAMQTGDIKNWLGDKTLQNLRAIGPMGAKLLEDMAKEFGAVGDKANATKPGEWRQITVPYMGEYGMATMRMAVRNHMQDIDPEERKRRNLPDDAGRVTRFLFDADFSEFGPLQVDGLLRPSATFQKQLDILLRTRELLPAPMRRELMGVYEESLGAYGMNGTLAFQAGYQNWIRLAEERSAGARV